MKFEANQTIKVFFQRYEEFVFRTKDNGLPDGVSKVNSLSFIVQSDRLYSSHFSNVIAYHTIYLIIHLKPRVAEVRNDRKLPLPNNQRKPNNITPNQNKTKTNHHHIFAFRFWFDFLWVFETKEFLDYWYFYAPRFFLLQCLFSMHQKYRIVLTYNSRLNRTPVM